MAFTTVYTFEFAGGMDLLFTGAGMDLTSLSGGGVAGVGDFNATQSNATFFDGDLAVTGTSTLIGGLNASLDQLANGNVVVAAVAAGDVVYRITTASGSTVLADTSVFEIGTSAPDTAALAGGGFVIATTDLASGANNNIEIRRYDPAGASIGGFVVDGTSANDQGGVAAGLADGGFAVAWTRTVAGPQTEAWYAVYEADGTVRKAVALLDTTGAVNSGMSIVALNTGGFAVAYQDTGWGGGEEITFVRFDAAGDSLGFTQASNEAGAAAQASMTALSNGMIALSYSTVVTGDNDIHVQLLDPATGALLLDTPHRVALTTSEETDSSAAGWGLAGLAVAFAGPGSDALLSQLVRTAAGDGADDLITGDDAIDRVTGGLGADTLEGLANDDTLGGGDGADRLLGGDGADTLEGGSGGDSLQGGDGDDWLNAGGGPENDTLDGGDGVDMADYSGAAGAVSVDLGFAGFQNTGGAGVDRVTGVEHLIGTAGNDSLTGNASDNWLEGDLGGDTLTGTGGDDTLSGFHGVDRLSGGAGDDLTYSGLGADIMSGGGGVDTLHYFGAGTFLDLADTTAQNTHSAGADTIIGFENVVTGNGDDRILGTGADNRFESFGGADTLRSKDGSDVLLAGGGDDLIHAGAGADLITGGGGEDFIRGGLGSDDFIYEDPADSAVGALADVIRDFMTSDGDRIDLSAVYAGELSYIGAAFFTGNGQGEIQVGAVIGGQLIRVDIDGDGDTDMDILVANSGLSGGAADFVL